MQLAGKHVVNASPSKVWPLLMDTDTLARIVPGITKLEKRDDNKFKSTLEVKIGPVHAVFTGNLGIEDISEEKAFTLRVLQNSKVGNANAVVTIDLSPIQNDQTEITFNGEVKLSGMLAAMGQRLVGGVSQTLTRQFFSNLERELENESAAIR